MDTDERQLIKTTLEIAKENNQLLKKLLRKERWAQAMRILYWLIILGSILATYYYLQPYIESAVGIYGNVDETLKILDGL